MDPYTKTQAKFIGAQRAVVTTPQESLGTVAKFIPIALKRRD
jgi:hypothetical protein